MEEERWPSILVNKLFFSFIHIGITLGAGEEVDKFAGRESGVGVDRIGEVGNRAVWNRFYS